MAENLYLRRRIVQMQNILDWSAGMSQLFDLSPHTGLGELIPFGLAFMLTTEAG